jgi:hypothetical protein
MAVAKLPLAVACIGAVVCDADAMAAERTLTVTFKTEEGDRYLVPLSEQALRQLLEVASAWHRSRDFADQPEVMSAVDQLAT